MPISDPNTATGKGTDTAPGTDYAVRLDAFLREHRADSVAQIFHAVRRLPYHSDGQRSPDAVMATGRGACTAKHILLRDLLRRRGEMAAVDIVGGDFAAGLPVSAGMPPILEAMIRNAGIADFHCYVVWRGPEGEVKLDATWHDALITHGFAVNHGWAGVGDTRLAIAPLGVKARDEDVLASKERLLAALTPDQAANRRAFLRHLSDWMARIPNPGEGI